MEGARAVVFALSAEGTAPLYQQIREGIRNDIAARALLPGSKLPSSRQLAADLHVSRITVANAYAELEADGLIESRAGSGTFVSPVWNIDARIDRRTPFTSPSWQQRMVSIPDPVRDRMLREASRPAEETGVIAFACAHGDVRLFPMGELQKTMTEVLREDGAVALGYDSPHGYPPLRQFLATYLLQHGMQVSADDVIITAGAQQGIDLIARALLQSGDAVAVESPTYAGVFECMESRAIRTVGIGLDAGGMDVAELQRVLERDHPKLIYTVPTFHNPTGAVMTAARRRELVTLAHRFDVPILEDDYMREVRFGSPIPPPIASFDQHGDVIYVGSFSKSLIPSLRLGYVVARGSLRDQLISLKGATDRCCSTLLQRVLWRLLERGTLFTYWKRASRIYRRRQSVMLGALRTHFPLGSQWHAAEGGFGVWVGVPPRVSVTALFDQAISAGVSIAVGAAFFPEPDDQPFMRLGFAAVEEQHIERGIAKLGRLIQVQLAQHKGAGTSAPEPG